MFSKKVNSLKYFFDFTNANTENINIEITSPNFENNFYPDFSYLEYKILSSTFNKINIKTENFNIDSLGDMIYLLYHKSDTMKLIKNNQTINTNDNDISVVFRTDCSLNVGRFKILVSFTRDNYQVTTQNSEISTDKSTQVENTSYTFSLTTQSPKITTEKTPENYTTYSYENTVPNNHQNTSLCSNIPVVLGGYGTIFSPNYPDHYPRNSQCKWLLKAGESRRLKVRL